MTVVHLGYVKMVTSSFIKNMHLLTDRYEHKSLMSVYVISADIASCFYNYI